LIKKEDMETPTIFNKSIPTHLNTKDVTIFYAKPLPFIKNIGAAFFAPPARLSTAFINVVNELDPVQSSRDLRAIEGAVAGDPLEFEFTPAVPSSISAPPHPMPFIKRFGPKNTPTMLLETWNEENLTITIPNFSWKNMQPHYDAL
jgi:hypothetical protein